ncbi:2TM domain-containing protein [Actinomycetospora lemnae]|uniref:2TM domain-containing protein n=1 Tax=Actinomycetospora lemnae TaxID=3019891 RepID=A0ABT5SZ17_9PSEU|nr:2TM domain-containing protein [Actinomycetospora sp. DW7H6]MDD7967956.1 2TM domain-containing protein [Actinomycetospora sp. DW7H6]
MLVNSMLVVIWAITGAALFWPIFPILGWGVGLAANAWDVYRPDPVTEERIQQEMGRLRP